MPNAAPPLHPATWRRAAESSPAPTAGPAASGGASQEAAETAPALTGVAASWAGLGALLTGAGERAPADARALAAIASGQKVNRIDGGPAGHLGAAHGHGYRAQRSPDPGAGGKGRLQLPVEVDGATRLAAERDGALVTVFLPAVRSDRGRTTPPPPSDQADPGGGGRSRRGGMTGNAWTLARLSAESEQSAER